VRSAECGMRSETVDLVRHDTYIYIPHSTLRIPH